MMTEEQYNNLRAEVRSIKGGQHSYVFTGYATTRPLTLYNHTTNKWAVIPVGTLVDITFVGGPVGSTMECLNVQLKNTIARISGTVMREDVQILD